MRTHVPSETEIERRWYLVDAAGQPLGRLASRIATILRGKHKPMFTPHLDVGDFVVMVNAEKVLLTGKKAEQKEYFRHSGYPGGERIIPFKEMVSKHPERVIELAVRGMMPRTNLARRQLRKLKVYAGPEHPHQAQAPEPLDLSE